MKLYKVLDPDLTSPFQNFQYETGIKYICHNFDENPEHTCSTGFYATEIEGLTYSFRRNKKIFKVEVSGKQVEIDQFKRRYEKIKIIRECNLDKIKTLAKKEEEKLGYKLSEILFPYYPFQKKTKPNYGDIENFHKWIEMTTRFIGYSVSESIRTSVGDSIWDSVQDCIKNSLSYSIRNPFIEYSGKYVRDFFKDSASSFIWISIDDCVFAYISSLFPNIKKWKSFDHKEGKNPFQSGIDLWNKNLIPIYDGEMWRLYSGRKAEIVYEEKVD